MYHTQEKRNRRLSNPIECKRKDAWLGAGYYFWDEEGDAHSWGRSSKYKTGAFEVYEADIVGENFLNTVFNEEDYIFFKKQIDKASLAIVKMTNMRPTIKDICEYINSKARWSTKLDGVLFQDLPTGSNLPIENFPYRKRIQAVVYNSSCIQNFLFKEECTIKK